MPIAFTREQQESIKEQLFQAGISLSKSIGVQRMTVSKLAEAAGIAKGSFYSFFESKEAFILALCEYAGGKTQDMLMKHLQGRNQMTTHEFVNFIREYMNSEYDLLNGLTLEDVLWLKSHMSDANLFDPTGLVKTMQVFFSFVSDVREDIDMGTVVNLIKGMYVMRESRDTLIEASLENSIEIMLRTLEIYISGKGDLMSGTNYEKCIIY